MVCSINAGFDAFGTSTGSHDDGIGEQDDLRDALNWLEGEYPHLPLVVGGFSFGSLVSLSVGIDDERIVGLIGLGLPVGLDDRYDFDFLADAGKPVLVVQGENDEFGSGEVIARALESLGGHIALVRIPDTDHYFEGTLEQLRAAVHGYWDAGPGARVLASF